MASKIKVDTIENVAGSGNVSLGSGHNLVVPGNITGQGTAAITGTATLSGNATVGGTLGVTGATTTTGITSSAAHTVTTSTHANASVFKSTGHTQLFLQDTDTSANLQFWGLQNSGGDINILRCNDDRASGFVTPMTITQEGHVKQPLVPRFLARKNTSSWSPSTNSTMIFDRTNIFNGYNVGGHYDITNGRFTCPEAGTYYFAVTSIVNTTVTNGAWYIYKNGGAVMEQHITQTSNGWTAHHLAFTGEFAASDYVTIQNGAATIGYYGSAWSFFHGRMLG